MKQILFAMHSPSTIPRFSGWISLDNYKKLFTGYYYVITFSQIDTILLPPNYVTNCRNYDINDKGYENMRSDCISKCFVDRSSQNMPQLLSFNRSSPKKRRLQ